MRPVENRKYKETANPNAAQNFPYLVREVSHGRSTPFDPGFHVMHWHDDFQFLFVAEGMISLKTLQDELVIKSGEAVFINKDIVHCIESDAAAHYYNFLFPAGQLRFYPGCPANEDLSLVLDGKSLPLCYLARDAEWERQALDCLETLADYTRHKPEPYAFHILVQIFQLLLLLRKNAPLSPHPKQGDSNAIRTEQVLQYMAAHYSEDITLDDLAKSAHCSKSACLRAFHLTMNTTPYTYLLEYRIEQAALLLHETLEPVGNIAATVGFHQVSLFGKYFKAKTGKTPKEYREMRR